MSTATAAITRDDIEKLDATIAAKQESYVEQRAAADALVAKAKESGKDPLADKEVFDEIDAAYLAADETAEEIAELREARTAGLRWSGATPVDSDRDEGKARRRAAQSLAQRLVESDEYQALAESRALKSEKASIALPPVEVASREEFLAQFFRAAVIDAGPLVPEDQRLVPPVGIPQREIRVIDLITRGSTDSDTIEWAEQVLRTNNAGGVPFGTKLPENVYTWTRRTENVRRRGAEVTATRGNLADQGQLRMILEALLTEDVRLELEDQVVNGDGEDENFEGIFNRLGINSVTRGDEGEGAAADETRIDALHRGLTVHRIIRHRDPTALLIHPTPHSQTVTAKGTDGHYLFVNPTQSDRVSIWGLPAVVSTVAPVAKAMWGTWTDAMLWVREGLTVQAFNQHEDYASKGLVLITAEHRAAFKAVQPRGFTEVDLADPVPDPEEGGGDI